MTQEQRITEILELILETDCDPTLACEKCPELLPEIRKRLEQVHRVKLHIDELFPDSKASNSPLPNGTRSLSNRLPTIPGYVIEGVLGSGGMGIVYKARHEKLNRVVALKMLRAGHFATSNELTRFTREFQAIAELRCAHIVQVHDVGDVDGRPYFTMEFVDGGSLAEQLKGKPQSARHAAELVAKLAEAIHSAHVRGIIHRDLKPANILMSQDGCSKIADFGLARHIECDHPLTLSGMQMGTPSYMAPEQAIGLSKSLGPAVDVYALGAILYEMLTGRPPFRAENAIETQRQVIRVDPVSPARINASVPRDLETICLSCLNKDPQRRYSTASGLAADLGRFLRNEPIEARPIGNSERAFRWIRRNPALTALACTAIALVCLAVTFALRELTASEQRQAETEKWKQRLEYVTNLEQEGRFTEARAILGRVPDGGSSELRSQIENAQWDLDLAEQLDAIRMSRGKFTQGGGIDYEESSRSYASVFYEAGFGQPNDNDAKLAAARIMNSTVRVALVAALDDWAACATAETRAWILAVARAADPDPWRDRVRDQQRWADVKLLETLADIADIEEQPVTLLVAMGTRWRRLGGDPKSYLQRVHHEYPGDFWLNFELAFLHVNEDAPAALAHNLAALAVRPNAASVHYNLAGLYERLEKLEEARFHYSRATELDPAHTWAEHRLAIILFNSGQSDEALNHFRRALELDPEFKDAKNGLRIALVKLGQLEEAASVWESTILDPTATHADVDGIAELLLYLGHEDAYHRVCEIMLERFGESNDALICERLGRTCLLKPDSPATTNKAVSLVDRAIANLQEEQAWAKPFLLFAKSLSDYREKKYEEAIAILKGEASTVLQPGTDLVLAMALHQIEDRLESLHVLTHAEQLLDQNDKNDSREFWLFELLRREAVALIHFP
jgi:eukaryotic-like serine/threonine-protein kinase